MAFRQARSWVCAGILTVLVSGSALANTGFMFAGEVTSQPIGHYNFSKLNPDECSTRSPALAPEVLTDALRTLLTTVTLTVNKAVTPMNDIDIFGKEEVWAYPAAIGDCEDYVMLKRRILTEKGISASNLLITVVLTSTFAVWAFAVEAPATIIAHAIARVIAAVFVKLMLIASPDPVSTLKCASYRFPVAT